MIQSLDLAWFLVVLSAGFSCLGTVLLKRSRLEVPTPSFWITLISPWFIGALVTYCVGLLLFAKALDRLPISKAVPVSTGIGFILLTGLSYWLFNERLVLDQVIAASLILAGIIVITR